MVTLEKIQSLIKRYRRIRNITERLCKNLETEDYVIQPVDFVSPPKWHLAHTTWFFETLILQKFMKDYMVFHEGYNYIFNSYYESLGKRVDREYRGTLSRPTVREVLEYRAYVDENMRILFQNELLPETLMELVELGLQHEQQHQELLIYDIKFILFSNPLQPSYFGNMPSALSHQIPIPDLKFREHPGGLHFIGANEDHFAWDNEKPYHKVYFESFKVADRLITNGEYLQFIQDGGYENFTFWLDDGWRWLKENNIKAPLFWQQKDNEWFEFSLYGQHPLIPCLPVTHVSYYEASAFAAWKGKRLLTEAEWETVAKHHEEIKNYGNFMEADFFHPRPSTSQFKVNQLLGDVWEWTSSSYSPYPGYRPYSGPLCEYNGKFMINHMVLRGGSCATPTDHIRPTYRNFFRPEHRWMFSGIRLSE